MDEALKPVDEDDESTTQFTVDLGEVHLTDAEVSALQSRITKLAIESVRQKAGQADARAKPKPKPKEPFVKIIFVKAIRPRPT